MIATTLSNRNRNEYAARASHYTYARDRQSSRIHMSRAGKAGKIRFLLLAAAMALSFGIGCLFMSIFGDDQVQAAAASESSASLNAAVMEKESIIVKPGDTLWSIAAARIPKGEDVRVYIHKLKQENGLASSSLQAGQILRLP